MSKLVRRLRQLTALLRHPGNLACKYDTPWDNALFSEVRRLFAQGRLETCFVEDLLAMLSPGTDKHEPRLEHLFDGDASGGSVTPFELRTLATLCRALRPRTILEIGTFEGRTTRNLALNAPDADVYTLCLPQEQCPFVVGRFFIDTEEATRIKQVYCDSRRYDYSTLPPMDLVFIDGDHSYEAVGRDTENALRVRRPGGVIVWHDFDRCHLATATAVLRGVALGGLSYRWLQGTSLAVGFDAARINDGP